MGILRRFVADTVDEVWCGDVTLIHTGDGPLYILVTWNLVTACRPMGLRQSMGRVGWALWTTFPSPAVPAGDSPSGQVAQLHPVRIEFVYRKFFPTRAAARQRPEPGSTSSATTAAATPCVEESARSPTNSKINKGQPHDGPVYTVRGDWQCTLTELSACGIIVACAPFHSTCDPCWSGR